MKTIYPSRTTFPAPDRVLAVVYILSGGSCDVAVHRSDIEKEIQAHDLFNISDAEFREYLDRKNDELNVLDADVLEV